MKKKISQIWRFMKGNKRFFLFSMLFAPAAASADMITPQIVRCSIDTVISENSAEPPYFLMNWIKKIEGFPYLKEYLWVISLTIIMAALIKVLSQYIACVCNTKGAETLSKTVRDSLFSHITRLPYSWRTKNRTGDIIQRCTAGIATMNSFLSEELNALFRVIILLALSILFILNMHIPLTLIALLTFPVIILNSILFDRKIEENFQNYDEGEGKLSAQVQENLTDVRVVRAFGQESREFQKFKKQNDTITKTGEKIGKAYGGFFCTSDILSGVQVMLVIICGAVFCIKGSMTAGEYIAFVSYNTLLA